MHRLSAILENFSRVNLLVVGDLMLDRFIWGNVERLSPEAPVPVLRVVSEKSSLGGAANVIHNVRTLGGRVTACGIVGNDDAGKRIIAALRRIGAATSGVIVDRSFQTIEKSRIIAHPHHQQIVRLDRENHQTVGDRTLKKLRDFIAAKADRHDAIVVSDYGKGAIHEDFLDWLSNSVRRNKTVCIVDPKKENYERYRLPTLVTPNKSEASEASGIQISDERSLVAAGKRLLRKWRARAVLITRGADGMSLFQPGMAVKHFPTEPRAVFEVTGAGDTVVAVCALALAGGAALGEAAVLANIAAGFVGDEVGTVAVPIEKLKRSIEENS
ncbi:MAG TPA: D-glycero-beta-D-manno-heptose-7-phosphate kinase [Candidatus Binatia bacterium]|nr:D-glycero-beta-D-manno-heptose-7-phosphate kinase [Candidatus Binatia bacterium]